MIQSMRLKNNVQSDRSTIIDEFLKNSRELLRGLVASQSYKGHRGVRLL
jgi:hypothetical protein